ncbi:hypothetical protein QFZ37_001945 [Chryseobacterium ginsenosidimutans]|uniref:hypothetical protein n=1 Tax=Chryseobacterium ginsenosidimutans TaxID=687846 RepID=UPI0027888B87|nr:hypothetical protein [Chryseobacterium ginsenosidimutans]MDQ0593576.1 hypothetical protein [Chryseobacterium ginsenosidimutans]
MYAKYIVLFFLLGISALLPAQTAEQNRINIRIFPAQILSLTTAPDSKKNTQELTVSNLYGYQIKVLNEKQTNNSQTNQNKIKDNCIPESKLIYSKTSSAIEQKMPTYSQIENLRKCIISNENRTLVYLIMTQ